MARCLMIPYGDRPGACPLGTLREFRPLRGSNCGPYGPGEWRIGNGGGASGAQNVGAGFGAPGLVRLDRNTFCLFVPFAKVSFDIFQRFTQFLVHLFPKPLRRNYFYIR